MSASRIHVVVLQRDIGWITRHLLGRLVDVSQVRLGIDVRVLSMSGPVRVMRSASYPLGREYGGEIVGNGSLFTFTGPRAGSEAGFSPNTSLASFEGDYHSHGADSKGKYLDEVFSPTDKQGIDGTGKPGFLVTPKGVMKRYDPDANKQQNGTVTVIGNVR